MQSNGFVWVWQFTPGSNKTFERGNINFFALFHLKQKIHIFPVRRIKTRDEFLSVGDNNNKMKGPSKSAEPTVNWPKKHLQRPPFRQKLFFSRKSSSFRFLFISTISSYHNRQSFRFRFGLFFFNFFDLRNKNLTVMRSVCRQTPAQLFGIEPVVCEKEDHSGIVLWFGRIWMCVSNGVIDKGRKKSWVKQIKEIFTTREPGKPRGYSRNLGRSPGIS